MRSNREEALPHERYENEACQQLTFVVSGEEFGIDIRHVREIVPYAALTRLPGAPEPVRGVTNLRGTVVPVVDLGIKFRLGESAPAVCPPAASSSSSSTSLADGS